MQVVTLDEKAFNQEAQKLSQKILDANYTPEMIIGIKSGGAYLSKAMQSYFTEIYYGEVSLQRPSTKRKKRFNIGVLLKRLPYSLTNILRKWELLVFEATKDDNYNSDREKQVCIDDDVQKHLKNIKRVLLVDDAIDSGVTMLGVKNVLLKINPNLEIKTAALTQTHKKSFIQADFLLYQRVLLRCMWAEDYHGL